MEIFKKEAIEKIPKSLQVARELEMKNDVRKEELADMLSSLESDLHITLTNDVEGIYNHMKEENCLVRVESLSRILEALELEQEILISDETDDHYANAVIPDNRGIQIAFSEGRAPGPYRVAVGFGKTIAGFKAENLKVLEVDFDPNDPRGAEERQYLCRHVEGNLKKEDIVSIVMRIPRHLVKEELLFDDEKENDSKFIFRGFSLK